MVLRFEYVAPPLPQLEVCCPAIYDLAETMRHIYPHAGKLGSMVRLVADAFGEIHTDERTVEQWLFARFCDLPSIDRALHLDGVTDVPRPWGKPLATSAAALADIDAQTISSDPHNASMLAASLFWYIADRVALISSRSAAAIILDAPGRLH
jgi:hypothetical protein